MKCVCLCGVFMLLAADAGLLWDDDTFSDEPGVQQGNHFIDNGSHSIFHRP